MKPIYPPPPRYILKPTHLLMKPIYPPPPRYILIPVFPHTHIRLLLLPACPPPLQAWTGLVAAPEWMRAAGRMRLTARGGVRICRCGAGGPSSIHHTGRTCTVRGGVGLSGGALHHTAVFTQAWWNGFGFRVHTGMMVCVGWPAAEVTQAHMMWWGPDILLLYCRMGWMLA